MRSFLLRKLIRDKVLNNMQELGQQITYHKLSDEDFLPELKRKLVEEATELQASEETSISELADIQEVIDQICRELHISAADLQTEQAKRREKRGGFDDRIYVERLDLKDDDPWAAYYAKEPDRFIEIKPEERG